MKAISRRELKQLAESVGGRHGWDFSRVRDARDPVPWEYLDVVGKYLKSTDRVLDIGCGGGEVFLSLAKQLESGTGIDSDPEMVAAGIHNKTRLNANNMTFKVMDAKYLDFDSASFDMVLNRQSAYHVNEVVRVLRPGGYFITQIVGHRNTKGVFDAFGWRQESFGNDAWPRVTELAKEFQQQNCRIIAVAEYDVPYRFLDIASFIFWLKAVPLPEEFDPEHHWRAFNRVLDAHGTEREIVLNEHRELLIAQKG